MIESTNVALAALSEPPLVNVYCLAATFRNVKDDLQPSPHPNVTRLLSDPVGAQKLGCPGTRKGSSSAPLFVHGMLSP